MKTLIEVSEVSMEATKETQFKVKDASMTPIQRTPNDGFNVKPILTKQPDDAEPEKQLIFVQDNNTPADHSVEHSPKKSAVVRKQSIKIDATTQKAIRTDNVLTMETSP